MRREMVLDASQETASGGNVRRLKTTCRCCSVQCGMLVTIDGDDRVLKAEGDPGHRATRGYSCGKGRAIPERHHSEERLLYPRIDGREVGWQECLADMGKRLNAVKDRHGAQAIGRFFGTGGAYDTLGLSALGRLIAALDTPQCYGAATVDVAPLYRAAQMVTGFHAMVPCWAPGPEAPSLAIMLGANFCVSHNYMGSDMANPVQKLREYRQAGGEVWSIDPRRTKSTLNSDHHLALKPNSDLYLLAWLVRELLDDGADEEELRTSCSARDITALRDAVQSYSLDRAARQDRARTRSLATVAGSDPAAPAGRDTRRHRHRLFSPWPCVRVAALGAAGHYRLARSRRPEGHVLQHHQSFPARIGKLVESVPGRQGRSRSAKPARSAGLLRRICLCSAGRRDRGGQSESRS